MRLRSDVNTLRWFGDDKARQYRIPGMVKARNFLLVDLRDFFFRFRVGGWKRNKIKKL